MRKIETADVLERRAKRNRLVLGIIIIGMLLLSTAGYALLSGGISEPGTGIENEDGLVYNGQYWIYSEAGKSAYFLYPKSEVVNITTSFGATLLNFRGASVFVDAPSDAVKTLVSLNLAPYVGQLAEACYGSCDRDLPERTCTDNGILLVWNASEETSVRQQDSCIFLNGDVRTVDAFFYKLFGI